MSKDFENNDKDFGLPEGYFERSAGNIMNRIEWLEEHKIYPKLSELKSVVPGFVVPEGYFNRSEHELELIPYQNLSRQKYSGFIVPADYFENQEVIEFSKVQKEEENELASFNILNRIPKANTFVVGENYFERSAKKIQEKLAGEKREARIINIFSRRIMYSAAAAVTAIVLGIWLYNQYLRANVKDDCTTLACLSGEDRKEIIRESLDEEDIYKMVDTKKLEEKLKGEMSGDKKNDTKKTDSSSTDDSYLNNEF